MACIFTAEAVTLPAGGPSLRCLQGRESEMLAPRGFDYGGWPIFRVLLLAVSRMRLPPFRDFRKVGTTASTSCSFATTAAWSPQGSWGAFSWVPGISVRGTHASKIAKRGAASIYEGADKN
jgi:hypothetical protein